MHFHIRDLSGAWWNRSPDNATNPFSIGGTPGAKLVALAVHEANLIFVDHVERLEFCENIARNGWLRPGTIIAVHDYPYIYSDGAFTARMLAVGCTKLMEDVSLLIFRSRIMAFQCGALHCSIYSRWRQIQRDEKWMTNAFGLLFRLLYSSQFLGVKLSYAQKFRILVRVRTHNRPQYIGCSEHWGQHGTGSGAQV